MLADETHEQTSQRGERMRRTVLGDAHVDASLQRVSEFSRPVQELVTEYCWGIVWGQEVLPLRTRSLLNLAMLAALNRPHEFAVHVRGALRNGVSVAEVQAVLLQVAVYAGMPAGLEAFRIAERAISEYHAETAAANAADGAVPAGAETGSGTSSGSTG